MSIKQVLLIVLLLAVLGPKAFSAKVERADAKRAAQHFMAGRQLAFSSHKMASTEVDEIIEHYHSGVLAFYVINFELGGFVILSADDILKPVIGYAYEGRYSNSNQPCCFKDFINYRAEEAAYAICSELTASPDIKQEWSQLLNGEITNPVPKNVMAEVLPLLTTKWNQDYPYNALCPVDAAGPGGRVYAGCVATAMAIIMHYWRYPVRGQGEKTHYTSYGPLYANFGTTFYNFDGMLNSINAFSGDAILPMALIQYHCGIAVNMSYSPSGSGAQSTSVPAVIKSFFGYRSSASLVNRSGYSYDVWKNLLKSQHNSGFPVYYSGFPSSGAGHAWVTDGFQDGTEDTFFHQNWGWGGAYNGFFLLTNLNPGNDPPFNMGQQAIINFAPPTDVYPYNCPPGTKIITGQRGSLEDGSGPVQNYLNNSTCSYLIAPADSVNTITLSFVRFNTTPNDILTIYDGSNASAPVLGTFSGSTLPSTVTSSGNRMYITFNTDASENANGFLAEYSCSLPVFCSGTVNLTAPSGTFSDGSGSKNYNNRILCRWWIKPPNASTLTLNFTSLDTETGADIVRVMQTPGNAILGDFSGNTLPGPIFSSTGQVMIIFSSNDFNTAQGFTAQYTTTTVGVSEIENFENFYLGPNPAHDLFNLAFSVREQQNVRITISTIDAKTVYLEKIDNLQGTLHRVIDVSAYTPGIYIVNLSSEKGHTTQKLVVN